MEQSETPQHPVASLCAKRLQENGGGLALALADIILESCLTTIMDMEDSVAAVDGEDKSNCYKNWSGLMKGDLETNVRGKVRKLEGEKRFIKAGGKEQLVLPGRGVLLIRNVGLHMYTDACLWDNQPIPEGILDLVFTIIGSLPDINGNQ